jgi:demethylmenaquinone methyltransferase/2-methoxy-6-polyprenyl-1,4-benzoquinol methylase
VRTNSNLIAYYSARALDYEEIYDKPERQDDLVRLRGLVAGLTTGMTVVELACGTGYWTRVMAQGATEIHAVDASRESIGIARRKMKPDAEVTFEVADLDKLEVGRRVYSTMVAGFLWSHVPVQEIDGFLDRLAVRLGSGTRAVLFDNRYVEGSSSPISHRDRYGNSYQKRHLASGESFTIVKNFPSAADLATAARRVGSDVSVEELEYYWLLDFTFG